MPEGRASSSDRASFLRARVRAVSVELCSRRICLTHLDGEALEVYDYLCGYIGGEFTRVEITLRSLSAILLERVGVVTKVSVPGSCRARTHSQKIRPLP